MAINERKSGAKQEKSGDRQKSSGDKTRKSGDKQEKSGDRQKSGERVAIVCKDRIVAVVSEPDPSANGPVPR